MRRHRLFVGAWPDAAALDVLRRLPRPDEPGVRWVRPEHWHVTLRFLGDGDPEEVLAALRSVPLPAATAVLGPQVARMGRHVVVVPVAGLDALGAAVVGATAGLGDPPDPRGLRGHLTLARLRHRGACGVAGERVAASFPVGEVALVDSVTRSDGPEYRVVGRVACTPPEMLESNTRS